jgi:glutathione synthase/RimK-type ligase-like ATP-grasp enzyme
MKYLIIDKRQRVINDNHQNISTASLRLVEELDKKNIPHDLAYLDQIEFEFLNSETKIRVNTKDIKEYSHIIFRGHDLHKPQEYELKRYIVDWAEQYNRTNPEQKLLIQNAQAIKNFPYYNKIAMAIFCSLNNIPYFETYYRTDGDYTNSERNILNEYPLIIKEYSGANRVQNIKGERKIKKNVFKIDSLDSYKQEFLKDQDLSAFFLQAFSTEKADIRIFVKLGKVIGGWKRESTDSFMTVSRGKYSIYNNPDQKIVDISQNVARLLGADFIAVDFMYISGEPLLQEFSYHPGFKAYETKTEGEPLNIAEEIITAFKE